jgi:hypothetical protein
MSMDEQPTIALSRAEAQGFDYGSLDAAASAWCIDADTQDNVIARRNALAALWAGRLMRLPEDRLAAYAASVHFADFAVAGDEDIVLKLVLDLDAAGISVPTATVRAQLAHYHKRALLETCVTD